MVYLTGVGTYDRMFGLDWQLLADSVLTLIAVAVLFFVMGYFLFNPARKMLEERRNKIRGDLTEAAKQREEALALKAEYEDKLKNINREAEEILSLARKKALENENRIIAEAGQEASRIMERAHRESLLEKQKMQDEIKQEIVTVASLMTEKLMKNLVNAEIQEQLIDETLKEMGDTTWLS